MEPIKKHYKNFLIGLFQQFPKGHLAAASTLAAGLCFVLAALPSGNAEATRQTRVPLEIPTKSQATPPKFVRNTPLNQSHSGLTSTLGVSLRLRDLVNSTLNPIPLVLAASAAETSVAKDEPEWQEFTVKSGDSLSIIFQRAGLNDRDIYELFNQSAEAKELRRIVPGQTIAFQLNDSGKLQQLQYVKDTLNSLNFTRSDDGFISKKVERQPDIQIAFRQATINSSLFMAGKDAGMASNLIMGLANIFAWDIDFALDIHRGDQFRVMYEERYLDGKKIGTGAILAAEFTNQGKTFQSVRYTNAEGASHYYTPNGESMRKEFLRMPVDFARISSHFNLNRKHPILHTIRAHKGTDYAAARGTPIKASGDGKVIFAGRKGGYGNTVILQHGQAYQTLYAHMHNFGKGVRVGTRVRQGQIIGYVGTTGLSTGPHLHYEFYVNGVVRNPMTVELPKARSIASAEKANFLAQTQPVVAQLEAFKGSSRLALASDDD
jgi:murein DD-endopeptidase MepM/ murein hydrolase activator NlpD